MPPKKNKMATDIASAHTSSPALIAPTFRYLEVQNLENGLKNTNPLLNHKTSDIWQVRFEFFNSRGAI